MAFNLEQDLGEVTFSSGQKVRARIFRSDGKADLKDRHKLRMEFLREQGAILAGQDGARAVFDRNDCGLTLRGWIFSFDEEALQEKEVIVVHCVVNDLRIFGVRSVGMRPYDDVSFLCFTEIQSGPRA